MDGSCGFVASGGAFVVAWVVAAVVAQTLLVGSSCTGSAVLFRPAVVDAGLVGLTRRFTASVGACVVAAWVVAAAFTCTYLMGAPGLRRAILLGSAFIDATLLGLSCGFAASANAVVVAVVTGIFGHASILTKPRIGISPSITMMCCVERGSGVLIGRFSSRLVTRAPT